MKPEDQAAFEAACNKLHAWGYSEEFSKALWQAAISHRDAQSQQVNQQMLEALRDCIASLGGINSDAVPETAKNAIAAAEAQPKPEPVRLTDEEVLAISHKFEDEVGRVFMKVRYANAIMDALERKRGGV